MSMGPNIDSYQSWSYEDMPDSAYMAYLFTDIDTSGRTPGNHYFVRKV